jgi:hypothetical protein
MPAPKLDRATIAHLNRHWSEAQIDAYLQLSEEIAPLASRIGALPASPLTEQLHMVLAGLVNQIVAASPR